MSKSLPPRATLRAIAAALGVPGTSIYYYCRQAVIAGLIAKAAPPRGLDRREQTALLRLCEDAWATARSTLSDRVPVVKQLRRQVAADHLAELTAGLEQEWREEAERIVLERHADELRDEVQRLRDAGEPVR